MEMENKEQKEIKENWLPVEEFDNYEVSDLGNVRNVKTGRNLMLNTRKGYPSVALCKDKKPIFKVVHRLVATAFVPNPDNKPQVNHTGEKTDNRACMLE